MRTFLLHRFRGILLAAFMAGSMMAAAPAADPVPVGGGDGASNKKASADATVTDAAKRTGKIGVGVYLDKGAGPSVNDLLRALGKFDQVAVTKLTAEQIRSGSCRMRSTT